MWLNTWATEPLRLATYPGGIAVHTGSFGEADKPLPAFRIAKLPECLTGWAYARLDDLLQRDFGQPGITDQGFTAISYRPAAGPVRRVTIYALGIGDQYVDNTAARANRAELAIVLDALGASVDRSGTGWTPDRVRLTRTAGSGESDDAVHRWPLSTPPAQLLVSGPTTRRCGVVMGADAKAIITELGDDPAAGSWVTGTETVRLSVAALVPGQNGCSR